MRTTGVLCCLCLMACAPAEADLRVNIAVSPAWGSQIVGVDLIDVGGDAVGRSCTTIETEAVVPVDCATFGGFIPTATPCALSRTHLDQDPGTAGHVLFLSAGEHVLTAFGLDATDNVVALDCKILGVVEGKTTAVRFVL